MWVKNLACIILSCVLLSGSIALPVSAAEEETIALKKAAFHFVSPMATNSFSMSIPAKSMTAADKSFPLAAGETVTIKASYSPFSASVDFGLVAPDGYFYYINITDGSIDETIQVSESGDYTFQVRNNSSFEVEVLGFVNY